MIEAIQSHGVGEDGLATVAMGLLKVTPRCESHCY